MLLLLLQSGNLSLILGISGNWSKDKYSKFGANIGSFFHSFLAILPLLLLLHNVSLKWELYCLIGTKFLA